MVGRCTSSRFFFVNSHRSQIVFTMAKGNLFLGGARGSVGDVTFYTKNGQQISRVRRRSVKNPNTSGQQYQRAILSTVVKAYQAGSAIFDHSFEGVATGAASQARFQKVNINLIRQLVEADVAANASESEHHAAVVPRGSVWPVPNVYRVSQGSLVQTFFTAGTGTPAPSVAINPPTGGDETVAEWLERNGIIDDDIFTIVGFGLTDASEWSATDGTRFRRSYECVFGWVRLRVSSAAVTSSAKVEESLYSDVFDIESSFSSPVRGRNFDEPISIADICNGAVNGAIGVIRSRENQRLRSTCDLIIPTTQPNNQYVQWGIVGKYIPEFWSKEIVELGQSPLILEGGPIDGRR